MSTQQVPIPQSPRPVPVGNLTSGSSSLWDRISTWASEHKGVVYTIAGVTLVVSAAGVIYYVSDSGSSPKQQESSGGKRKSKKDRRKTKKEAEETPKEEAKAGK